MTGWSFTRSTSDVRSAIDREKQIKGWLRIKKMELIVSENPEWRDRSEEWGKPIAPLTQRNT